MLFWACSIDKPEGYRVSQALRENSYPFLALIVLRFNRMTVVSRIEGPIDAQGLIARLRALMDSYEETLLAARLEREERSFNQTLREQQDVAYQESLRADQEKERLRRESLEREKQVEQDAMQRQLDEIRRREEIVQRKEVLRQCLPREPDPDDPDAIKILLKLPNGVRLERRFCKDDSLQSLHDYVFVHEAAPDDFQIVTNFPRRVLPSSPSLVDNDHHRVPLPTFAEFGLGRSEMLFVHDNEA
jgi:FAS-associated factor 2